MDNYLDTYKKNNLATSLLQGGKAAINKFSNNQKGIGEIPSIAYDVKAPRINKDESTFREQEEDLDEMTNRTLSDIRLSGRSEMLPSIYENYRKSLEKIGQNRSRYGNQIDNQNAAAEAEAANKTAAVEAQNKQYQEQIASQRSQMLSQANAQNDNVINQSIAGFMNNNLKAKEMELMQEHYQNNPSLWLNSLFPNARMNTPGQENDE